jgi:uncharacterized protein YllA (UPF0747 family)
MAKILAKIRLDEAEGYNRLFLDFAANPSRGIPGHLPGVERGRGYWDAVLERVDRESRNEDADTRRSVMEDVARLSERLGTRSDVLEKLRAVSRREAFLVVTGQQPGLFGGPLLTAYKAFTSVALADILEGTLSRPVVPLYWCGSDDTDFAEIRAVTLLSRQSIPVSTSLPQEAHVPGAATGGISVDWHLALWKTLRRVFGEFERGADASRVVEQAFAAARDHGEHASAILVALCGGRLAVIDGRSPSLRVHARRLILDYVQREEDIKRLVAENGRRLTQAGYHAQLTVGEDSGVFLLEDGLRKSVAPERRSSLVEAATNSIERCSPGVIARNLVQDGGLLPVAVVLGPAEIAYRCQMGPLYGLLGVPTPAPVPRLAGTFVPPALAELLERGGMSSVESAIERPADFARSVFDAALPAQVREASERFEREVAAAVGRLSRALDANAPERAATRIRSKLEDFGRRAASLSASLPEIGKATALERWSFLADLASLLRPGGKPQERTISALAPCLSGGAEALDDLLSIARSHVDEVLDGRSSHIVYSPPK